VGAVDGVEEYQDAVTAAPGEGRSGDRLRPIRSSPQPKAGGRLVVATPLMAQGVWIWSLLTCLSALGEDHPYRRSTSQLRPRHE